jgi:cytochrome c553
MDLAWAEMGLALHCKMRRSFGTNPLLKTMKSFTARIALVLATAALAFGAQAAEDKKAAKPDTTKGSAIYGQMCASCHGADGNSGSPENPKLAGQHPEYLVKQLQEFKSGKRASAVMSGMVAALSEADMKGIAYWLGEQKAKTGFAKDKELVAMGERIYRGGIADRNIAACAGCHNPTGAGIPAQFPRVGGQHAAYSEAQLKAFRDGARKNSVQMTQIAAKMNDKEIKAVSDYMAGLR